MQNSKKVEVLYKKEIRGADKIKCFYVVSENVHYAVIKSYDEENVHAIVKLTI